MASAGVRLRPLCRIRCRRTDHSLSGHVDGGPEGWRHPHRAHAGSAPALRLGRQRTPGRPFAGMDVQNFGKRRVPDGSVRPGFGLVGLCRHFVPRRRRQTPNVEVHPGRELIVPGRNFLLTELPVNGYPPALKAPTILGSPIEVAADGSGALTGFSIGAGASTEPLRRIRPSNASWGSISHQSDWAPRPLSGRARSREPNQTTSCSTDGGGPDGGAPGQRISWPSTPRPSSPTTTPECGGADNQPPAPSAPRPGSYR